MPNFDTFDVFHSINSGQVFLWKKNENFWYGVNGGNIIRIDIKGNVKSYKDGDGDFFRRNDDMKKISRSICKDKVTRKAVKEFAGMRLFQQDPFQCLISFIISSNSNIQKIRTCLEKISAKFGEKVVFDSQEFFLFPKPENLANAKIEDIAESGTGYRSEFVREAARMVSSKQVDLERIREMSYWEARKHIMTIPGVGNKVADCVMLFSLDKLESFPLDRWMIRVLEKYYSDKFRPETKTMTGRQYEILHEKIVDYFGPYAGYAQQFLFKMERDSVGGKWL